jgi:hypothetical protein
MSTLTTSTKSFIGRDLGVSTLFRAFVVVFVFLGNVTTLYASIATWNPNTEPDIQGYILSWGTTPGGPYPNTAELGNGTSCTVALSPGRYYFIVQAKNTSGLMSDASSEVMFDVPPPSLTSLSPPTGLIGTSVTISGANFGATQETSSVGFNGIAATPTNWSTTSIVAPVPTGATTGPVVVTVGGVASNGWTFTIIDSSPSITSLLPDVGPVGALVTISGANFGATQGSSTVRFNGTAATPTAWSTTSIVIPVPPGATTGPVVVTIGGVASNGLTFTVSTSGTLPAPWLSEDVGSPALTGLAEFSAGTFSVTGAGADIWGTNDQFQFVYQPVDGDATITARVDSLQFANEWAKAGVMIREDLTGDAPYAAAFMTAGHGLALQHRATRGGQTASLQGSADRWIRVVRSGSTVSGYSSPNGTTTWTLMGSFTIALPTRVYVGLAVASVNPTVTNTATFSNVTVETVAQAPSIANLSPPTGPIGTSVTISGANFGATQGSSTVGFNGTAATPTTWSTTSIVVPVPTGATTGPVVVTVDGVASSGLTFTVSVTRPPPGPPSGLHIR